MSMSLDGFVAGAGDRRGRPLGRGGEALFDWYFRGGTVRSRLYPAFRLSQASARVFGDRVARTAAVVSGRRTCEIANGWHGDGPLPGAPLVVLTHRPPKRIESTNYTFATGILDAVAQARARVRRRGGMVMVMGSQAIQAALRAGLLDEIEIDLVPILLGDGVPLLTKPLPQPLKLASVVEAPGVTHLRYSVPRMVTLG